MFGPFDDLFDFNGDGKLDPFEQGSKYSFLDDLEKEDHDEDGDDDDED